MQSLPALLFFVIGHGSSIAACSPERSPLDTNEPNCA